MNFQRIKNNTLLEKGFIVSQFPLIPQVEEYVKKREWKLLDDYFIEITKPHGLMYSFFQNYLEFGFLEHIIAIRNSIDDEEGIWHDDGSRYLGFSLSLNINPESIEGGVLNFKLKSDHSMQSISPLPYGQIVIFLSGEYGYEHQVSRVTKGERIVIAGWCSL